MSRSVHRHRSARGLPRQPRLPTSERPVVNPTIAVIILIAILTAIPFSLGKYFEFNSPGAFDCGAYVYSAARILSGAKIGVQEKPSAQIGTLLVNMIGVRLFGFSDTGPKLMQTIFQAAALVLMFVATRRLFGTLAAAVAVIIASVYLSAPLIAKYGNVKEQFMIAFMVIGVSFFVLYQCSDKWWYALLAGGFLSWSPLFKQTGVSAVGAVGLFVLLQPALKHRTFRQTGRDILLLLGGVVAAVAPLYVWILGWHVQLDVPYAFIWQTLGKMLAGAAGSGQAEPAADYVGAGRKLVPFAEQWPRVMRYYGLLILPIALAAGAIVVRILRMIWGRARQGRPQITGCERFVLLLGLWWVFDMALVWVSPYSYEEYYLPLNGSAAMLGAYLVGTYHDSAKNAASKPKWAATGVMGLLLMMVLSWHIFFGIKRSPHSGMVYLDAKNQPERTRGYAQKFAEIHDRRRTGWKYPWENAGLYIQANSKPADKLYVWGWVPGIYVAAQRFSSASNACCMPRPVPPVMVRMVADLLAEFKAEMPKFIVDTRKRDIPTERPPYVLWPMIPKGMMGATRNWFLPNNERAVADFDAYWAKLLRKSFDEDEALRYEAMAPFRKFVMDNYEPADPGGYMPVDDSRVLLHRAFGEHIVFVLKSPPAVKEQ